MGITNYGAQWQNDSKWPRLHEEGIYINRIVQFMVSKKLKRLMVTPVKKKKTTNYETSQ
jgi:hypothetical protein